MLSIMPKAITGYFASEATNDTVGLATWFAPDAIVHDEAHTHKGIEAIRAWKAKGKAETAYTIVPISNESRGGRTIVAGTVVGNFPGSPVVLNYSFLLRDGLIADLEILQ